MPIRSSGEEAAQRAGADKYQELAVLNRIASARFGWQPRFFNPRLERWLHRVNVPTHVIWGDGDRIIPPAYAEAFHRLIPGSTLTMIPNAGHLPHIERAPAVVRGDAELPAQLMETNAGLLRLRSTQPKEKKSDDQEIRNGPDREAGRHHHDHPEPAREAQRHEPPACTATCTTCLTRLEADEATRVLVLTGAGPRLLRGPGLERGIVPRAERTNRG